MSRVLRSLVRLSVGLFTALLMGAGSVAYASQPVPDVPSDTPQLPEYGPTSQVQDPVSMVQQIGCDARRGGPDRAHLGRHRGADRARPAAPRPHRPAAHAVTPVSTVSPVPTTAVPVPMVAPGPPSPVSLSDPLWQQVGPWLVVGAGIALTILLLAAALLLARGSARRPP